MRDDLTFNAWQRLAGREPLEVVEGDPCGRTHALPEYETGVECDGVIVAMTRRVTL
jgi:hypothetical protein